MKISGYVQKSVHNTETEVNHTDVTMKKRRITEDIFIYLYLNKMLWCKSGTSVSSLLLSDNEISDPISQRTNTSVPSIKIPPDKGTPGR
jgi:hypothetical protein